MICNFKVYLWDMVEWRVLDSDPCYVRFFVVRKFYYFIILILNLGLLSTSFAVSVIVFAYFLHLDSPFPLFSKYFPNEVEPKFASRRRCCKNHNLHRIMVSITHDYNKVRDFLDKLMLIETVMEMYNVKA